MSDEIKPISLLYMWLLVTRGGEALLRDIRPEFKPEYRRPLVAKGLITEEPAGRSKRIAVTDAGWAFLSAHMTSPIITNSAAASSEVLQGVLLFMHRHMQANDVSLAEICSPPPAKARPAENLAEEPTPNNDLWLRLTQSWSQLQEADDGIRLEKLRRAFADAPRERLDRALLEWQRQGKIIIYPYDDGERITPEVKEAALRAGGRDLHIIYRK